MQNMNLLKTLGQIAGLGGISLGTFVIIFRDVIRKRIFPRLGEQSAYRLLRLILVLTWTIAILGIGAWTFMTYATRRESHGSNGRLQLVETQVLDSKQFPILDFKLRNTGEVAFLKSAEFKVQRVWEIMPGMLPDAVPASWNYDLILPALGAPYSLEKPISQVVKAGDVDRFTFTIGTDAPPSLIKYMYLISVDLIYDEDNKRLNSPALLFVTRPQSCILGETSGKSVESFDHNIRVIEELGTFNGVSDEEARSFLRDYANLPDFLLDKLRTALTTEEKQRSLKVLGLLGNRAMRALPQIEAQEKDPDIDVREAARIAAGLIRVSPPSHQESLTIDSVRFRRWQDFWKSPPQWAKMQLAGCRE
jgi:hypothetical protein